MKSKGRVRNYVVSNKEVFCDTMAKSLCEMQVRYVQVDNEFHFNDKIYRFYSFDECLELDGKVVFVHFDEEKLVSLNPRDLLFTKTADDLARYLEPQFSSVVDTSDALFDAKSSKKGFNKQKIKYDNVMVNQRLKNSFRKK